MAQVHTSILPFPLARSLPSFRLLFESLSGDGSGDPVIRLLLACSGTRDEPSGEVATELGYRLGSSISRSRASTRAGSYRMGPTPTIDSDYLTTRFYRCLYIIHDTWCVCAVNYCLLSIFCITCCNVCQFAHNTYCNIYWSKHYIAMDWERCCNILQNETRYKAIGCRVMQYLRQNTLPCMVQGCRQAREVLQ